MEYAQAKANMNQYNRWSMKQDGLFFRTIGLIKLKSYYGPCFPPPPVSSHLPRSFSNRRPTTTGQPSSFISRFSGTPSSTANRGKIRLKVKKGWRRYGAEGLWCRCEDWINRIVQKCGVLWTT
jgi:hypothetical protein